MLVGVGFGIKCQDVAILRQAYLLQSKHLLLDIWCRVLVIDFS